MPMFARFSAILCMTVLLGCAPTTVKLFEDYSEPLKEFTLSGQERDKVLLLSVRGFISHSRTRGFMHSKPSLIQEVASQLEKARLDPDIKAIVLLIDTPGGSTTASDILYHEISKYSEETGTRVVACLLGMATSGGYYTALAADRIVAHPTTVTGSVGTVFLSPRIDGLMDKIGVGVTTYKSGKYKDMGSLFRKPTKEEARMFNELIHDINEHFVDLVRTRRNLTAAQLETVAEARVFTASQALNIGLVDSIGYAADAVSEAKSMAGVPQGAQVIVYRRTFYADDNIYNPVTTDASPVRPVLADFGLADFLAAPEPGFYYLWAPQYH